MANVEHLDLLNQGIWIWNQWRTNYPNIQPDLSKADLRGTDLSKADLQNVDFRGADLPGSDCSYCNLQGANLSYASMYGANFYGADLSYANLQGADLFMVNLGANLYGANLSWSDLSEANFSQSAMGMTLLGNLDLRLVKGLEYVTHHGPSSIGVDTIIRSRGKIPEIFLRNVGVPNPVIEAIPTLLDSLQPINYYSCFISYSSHDEKLARRLHNDLQKQGVNCWFAPVDLKIGDKIRTRKYEAIHLYDKLLLLLSEHAIASAWVEDEVEAALEKEQWQQREVLFPVRLDESVMQTSQAWAAKLRRVRHIGDFTHWQDPPVISAGI